MRKLLCIALIAAILGLAACAPKKIPTREGASPVWMKTPEDVLDFPQNLTPFANAAGQGKVLIDSESQAVLDARFNSIFFGPWQMARATIKRGEASGSFRNARGFKDGSTQWTREEWDAMRNNANLADFPSLARQAITLRDTDLRELPTHERRFSEPVPDIRANPFDYFQYARLPIGTPLLVAHTSLDGRWHYVECPIAGGWVDASDMAFVDADFRRLWQSGAYAALLRDKVVLPGTGPAGKDSLAGIGTVLPFQGSGQSGGLNVLVPVRGTDGFARAVALSLAPGDAGQKPLSFTAGNMAKIGNAMMGQPYGWGGTLGERDCSAMIRDLFAPFGLWLPRNSAAQAKRGHVLTLAGLPEKEKEAIILRDGEPFLSLVGMAGHITLYVGAWKGRPAIFHNVWGVRIVEAGDDDARFVIGRAVVTSITPGAELKNLYRPVTFAKRVRTLTRLGAK